MCRCSVALAALLCSLVLLAHVAYAQQATTEDNAMPWDTCGGLNGPNKKDVVGAECPAGYTCIRQDKWYWQCKENKSVLQSTGTPPSAGSSMDVKGSKPQQQQQQQQQQQPHAPKTVEPWAQCGGMKGDSSGKDSIWPHVACPMGYECVRQDKWFYNCKSVESLQRPVSPVAPAKKSAPVPKPAAPEVTEPSKGVAQPARPLPPQLPEDYLPKDKVDELKKKGNKATETDFDRAAGKNATKEQLPPLAAAVPTSPEATAPAKPATPTEPATAAAATAPAVVTPPLVAPEPVKVGLQFQGVTVDEFKAKYAQSSRQAVASVAGVTPESVTETIYPAAAGTGTRRLLQAAGVDVTYSISSSDRTVLLQRIDEATADGGAGLNRALAAAGVPLRPAVSVDGVSKVKAQLEPSRATAATASPVMAASTAPPAKSEDTGRWKVIVGAVVGAVGGALLLVLVLLAVVYLRRCKSSEQPQQQALLPDDPIKPAKKAAAKDVGANDIEMARDTRGGKGADQGHPTMEVTATSESPSLAAAAAAGAAAAAALPNPSVQRTSSARVVVEPMAPAEAYPRSFPMGAVPPPVRTGKLVVTDDPTHDDLPRTPGSGGDAGDGESFQSGEEAFATPRSAAGSEASFKSATGGGTSEASFRTAGAGSVAASFASARSNASRMSSATAASRHESATEFPQAFVPRIPDDASSEGSAEELPVVVKGSASAGGSQASASRVASTTPTNAQARKGGRR